VLCVSVRHVIPEGLAEIAPGSELARALVGMELSRLSGFDGVEVLKAQYRQANHERSRVLAAMTEVGLCGVGPAGDELRRRAIPDEFSADEVRAALALTRRAADAQFSLGWDLVTQLPQVHAAMDAGVWFHTSSDYSEGRVFKVLRRAFDEARSQTPPCIVKIYCPTADKTRAHVEDILQKLAIEKIGIAQLCCGADFAADFAEDGPRWRAFKELQDQGKIGNYVAEIFHPASRNALQVAEADLMDADEVFRNRIRALIAQIQSE